MFNIDELRASASAVYHVMPATPQYTWPLLSKRLNCEVWVKHENHTPTGAFKIRGGIIFINCLLKREPKEGANKQVISSQADSLIKISRIWA
ncbi:pyridoxal-phosphate dependent enzyme, partial [Raoultella ornithinolytica]